MSGCGGQVNEDSLSCVKYDGLLKASSFCPDVPGGKRPLSMQVSLNVSMLLVAIHDCIGVNCDPIQSCIASSHQSLLDTLQSSWCLTKFCQFHTYISLLGILIRRYTGVWCRDDV